MRFFLMCAVVIGTIASLAKAATQEEKDAFRRPLSIPFPTDNPYSFEIATLGKMLFFDPRLSGAQNMSCASCHNPSFGWETPVDLAVGAANAPLPRHAPTVLNSAWINPFFWDGRAETLEEQAAGPITAEMEMNAEFDDVITRLSQIEEYVHWFEIAFPGEGITKVNILRSIATYERTIVSGWSRFDRWIDGDDNALTQQEVRGFDLFVGEAQCSQCHTGWNMTDNEFHDIGLITDDIGRAAVSDGASSQEYSFKTPGLRNIALRAPYMHNGQIATMPEVIEHYASGGADRLSRDVLMPTFQLSDTDLKDLVAFLATLTEENIDVPTPILPAN